MEGCQVVMERQRLQWSSVHPDTNRRSLDARHKDVQQVQDTTMLCSVNSFLRPIIAGQN